jgi:hypothetical protein
MRPASPSAPPPPPEEQPELSPEEARKKHVSRVQASGPDQRGLLELAQKAGESFKESLAKADLEVRLNEWECYRGGCLVSAVHEQEGLVDRATDVITHSEAFHQWDGEKMRTGPVRQSDGKTEVVWILYAPAEAQADREPEKAAPMAAGH